MDALGKPLPWAERQGVRDARSAGTSSSPRAPASGRRSSTTTRRATARPITGRWRGSCSASRTRRSSRHACRKARLRAAAKAKAVPPAAVAAKPAGRRAGGFARSRTRVARSSPASPRACSHGRSSDHAGCAAPVRRRSPVAPARPGRSAASADRSDPPGAPGQRAGPTGGSLQARRREGDASRFRDTLPPATQAALRPLPRSAARLDGPQGRSSGLKDGANSDKESPAKSRRFISF